MSEALTTDAPLGDLEVPSVEVDAPQIAPEEVAAGSAPVGDLIPKARFDGLMGRFNRTQNELQAAQSRLAELESLQTNPPEETQMTDTSALEAQINTLSQMLMEERADKARRQVLDDYPELAPFSDLLVGNDPDELREVAKIFSERLKQVTDKTGETTLVVETDAVEPAAAAPAAAPVPEVPVAPVAGGGVTFSGEAAVEDRVAEAVKNKDFLGFLRAKREQSSLLHGDEVLEG